MGVGGLGLVGGKVPGNPHSDLSSGEKGQGPALKDGGKGKGMQQQGVAPPHPISGTRGTPTVAIISQVRVVLLHS